MPFQTHHLQHVHPKTTLLGPEGLSATHFPKICSVDVVGYASYT